MLRTEAISKSYSHRGRVIQAMDSLTVEIPKGDFVAIVGPSGSGKSTLVLALGGMLTPTSGRVFLDEESLYEMPTEQRAELRKRKLGFVFQSFNLVPYLTAMENVQVPLMLADRPRQEQEDRARLLLERVGLGERLDHKPGELSVGQQQRVALARMLANEPSVILADEPTGNLDPETGGSIQDFLEELNGEGRTIVMVTHDPRAAARARRQLRLVDGRLANA
jgi:putative ABC transport system ATP-binding protein